MADRKSPSKRTKPNAGQPSKRPRRISAQRIEAAIEILRSGLWLGEKDFSSRDYAIASLIVDQGLRPIDLTYLMWQHLIDFKVFEDSFDMGIPVLEKVAFPTHVSPKKPPKPSDVKLSTATRMMLARLLPLKINPADHVFKTARKKKGASAAGALSSKSIQNIYDKILEETDYPFLAVQCLRKHHMLGVHMLSDDLDNLD